MKRRLSSLNATSVSGVQQNGEKVEVRLCEWRQLCRSSWCNSLHNQVSYKSPALPLPLCQIVATVHHPALPSCSLDPAPFCLLHSPLAWNPALSGFAPPSQPLPWSCFPLPQGTPSSLSPSSPSLWPTPSLFL